MDNELRGNLTANILTDLGGGDVYGGQNTGDTVAEAAGGGVDKLYSAISWTLGANVENLSLTGTAYQGQVKALDNSIDGNSSANLLFGGNGKDTLAGNGGNDIFLFNTTLIIFGSHLTKQTRRPYHECTLVGNCDDVFLA